MENNRPLYNSRIIDTFIKLIKSKYSFVNINELLSYAKMKPYEVADQGHWFTQEQVDLFYEKLVKVTGNKNIAHEAGQYAASPDALGVMRQYVLGFVSPSNIFEMVKKSAYNMTRSSVYESKKISSNKVEIIVTPNEGVAEKPFQCENRIGFFETIVLLFNHKLPEIVHTECIFRGAKACRYIITWENTKSSVCKRIRNILSLVLPLLTIAMLFMTHWHFTITFITASMAILLLINMIAVGFERNELRSTLDNFKNSTDELVEQINITYNNSRMANEIGQAISKQTDIDNILDNVIQILEKRLDFDRGMILLANSEKSRLVYRNGYGYTDDQSKLLKKTIFHLDRPESKGIFVISFREQKSFLINDFNEIESNLSPNSLAFAKKIGAQSFIVCPIICEGESLGILAVDNLETKRPLIDSDMSLLMGIAPVIGISIRNAAHLEARVKQFNSTLQVLAASIDARDNLTSGHSDKVTEYAMGICEELGLPYEYREMIRVASLLHDYGKIGVPDAILKKPGRLTPDEHDIVKSHSTKTREILEQINFEGIYCQVPEIAGSHHERVDGTGYPDGLKSKDIPLGAKIIAVADFFEAVTAKRHYRGPMPVNIALQLLQDGVGKHFEKKIVDAFFNYFMKTRIESSEESSGKLDYIDCPPKRFKHSFPVTFQLNGIAYSGTGIDISADGMFIAVEQQVWGGSEIELSFIFPDSNSHVYKGKARVAWVNSGKERRKPSLPIGFGVEFVELNAPMETMLGFLNPQREENLYVAGRRPAKDLKALHFE